MGTPRYFMKCLALVAVAGMAAVAAAEQPQATDLATSEAQGYVGTWNLTVEFQGRPVQMELVVADLEGKIGATVNSQRQPEPAAVTEADITDEGIQLIYPMSFGGNDMTMVITAKLEEGKLTGEMAEASGLFSATLTGEAATGGAETETAEAAAPALEATGLDAAEVRDYLGQWKLNFEFQGQPVEMGLVLGEVDGKLGASISSDMQPAPINITKAELSDVGLKMSYPMDFGGNAMTMNIAVRINEEGGLTGTLAEASGLFSVDLKGEKGEVEVASRGEGDDDDDGGEGRRGRRGASPAAQLKVGDKTINIAFADLKMDAKENDYATLTDLDEGNVFKFVGGRATKLRTDLSLKFGDTLIKKENVAPDYPGVYSLWLKRASDGWKLVFNEHVDIWGTQHESEMDVAEIPLEYTASETVQDTFKVELVEEGENAGTLKITWGPHVWTAKFTIVRDDQSPDTGEA